MLHVDLGVRIQAIGEVVTVEDEVTNEIRQVGHRQRVGDWTLMAVVTLSPGHVVAVFENLRADDGAIVYADEHGVLLALPKSLVPTQSPAAGNYRGHSKAEVLDSDHDILRSELLAQEGEPAWAEVSACFPPIRQVRNGNLQGPHTFVGSAKCADVVPFYYNAMRGSWRVHPLVVAPEIRSVVEQEEIWEGLVGGWLPVVRFVYRISAEVTWEIVMYGEAEPASTLIQPVWYRYLRLEGGEISEAHYIDSYLPYPVPAEAEAASFYRKLYLLHGFWRAALQGAMQLDLPEPWIHDFSRHAMVREMITRIGDHPRYGVFDRSYGSPDHDGFQDVLNSAVSCYLEWGLFDRAAAYLENYFTEFVRADGSIRYRGPEISQYARTLVLLAQYTEFSGDDELLLKYDQKIRAIVNILMVRREQAKQMAADSPAYGMIRGRHEADISFVTPTLATLDYEQPYFCNSTEACRGFKDLGRVWSAMGARRGDAEISARGQQLLDEANAMADDIGRAIERSILTDRDLPYLPLIAGSKEYHIDAPYRSRPESFDENRVWSEVMHSGVVKKETVETILAYNSAHRGTVLGIFGNRRMAVAFQCYGEAYGLIQHDLIREFLLFYYAHAAHMHTRGTWTAFECVDMDRDRGQYAAYCAPAQMTIPTITKWMLVFEDPLAATLWLGKATPRAWLAAGRRIAVKNAPTRWGSVSYEVTSHLDEGRVRASISLPSGFPGDVLLRLRVPKPHTMDTVWVSGQRWPDFDPLQETVQLPRSPEGRIELEVRYR